MESVHQTVSKALFLTQQAEGTKLRTGLKNQEKLMQLLAPQLPKGMVLGEAYDQGDCFFDALAQLVNKINNTELNTAKYLRSLCHDFYIQNKALVDEWNASEYGGLEGGRDDYYFVQYTVEECEQHFRGRAPIWGRPNIEGKILCHQLQLEAICVIEILKDPETQQPVSSFYLVDQINYKNITEAAERWLKNPKIPVIVVEQTSLHFVPVINSVAIQKRALTQFGEHSPKIERNIIVNTAPDLIPQFTEGDGDCAFHAIFGLWNGEKFICNDVAKKRSEVASHIRKAKAGDKLYEIIQEAIKAIIMENRSIGPTSEILRLTYQQYLKDIEESMCNDWNNFEVELKKHEEIIKEINEIYSETNKPNTAAIKLKFNTILSLDEKGEFLRSLILSIPSLDSSYKEYQRNCSKDFAWNEYIAEQSIIEEYANFIATEGNWLLSIELNIIACVFNLTIDFYIKNVINETINRYETYNLNGSSKVAVFFNGLNHYERMENSNKLKSIHKISTDNIKEDKHESTVNIATSNLNEFIPITEASELDEVTITTDKAKQAETVVITEQNNQTELEQQEKLRKKQEEELNEKLFSDISSLLPHVTNPKFVEENLASLNSANQQPGLFKKAINRLLSSVSSSKSSPLPNRKAEVISNAESSGEYSENLTEQNSKDEVLPHIEMLDDQTSSKAKNYVPIDIPLSIPTELTNRKETFWQKNLLIEDSGEKGIYTGELNNEEAQRHGIGVYSSKDGEKYYVGEWKDDAPNGMGFLQQDRGAKELFGRFEGQKLKQGWITQNLNGQKESYNHIYKGQMKDGKYHGLGILKFIIGKDKYRVVGSWRNGKIPDGKIDRNDLSTAYEANYNIFIGALNQLLKEQKEEMLREYLKEINRIDRISENEKKLLRNIEASQKNLKGLKEAAGKLANISNAYAELSNYTNIKQQYSYRSQIKNFYNEGLKIYKYWIIAEDKKEKFLLLADILNFEKLDILAINPNVIHLIKEILLRINSDVVDLVKGQRDVFVAEIKKYLMNFWDNYKLFLVNKNQDDEDDNYDLSFQELIRATYARYITLKIKDNNNFNTNYENIESKIKELNIFCNEKFIEVFKKIIEHVNPWGASNFQKINQYLGRNDTNNNSNALFFDILIKIFNESMREITALAKKTATAKITNYLGTGTNPYLYLELGVNNEAKWKPYNIHYTQSGNIPNGWSTWHVRDDDNNYYGTITLISDVINITYDKYVYEENGYYLEGINLNNGHLTVSIIHQKDEQKKVLEMKKNIVSINKNLVDTIKEIQNEIIDLIQKEKTKLHNFKDINYEKKYKEIHELIKYFIQLVNSDLNQEKNIGLQLDAIINFIEEKIDLSEIVECFSTFNKYRAILSKRLSEIFSKNENLFKNSILTILQEVDKLFSIIINSKFNGQNRLQGLNRLNDLLIFMERLDLSWYVKTKDVSHEWQARTDIFTFAGEHQTVLKINFEKYAQENNKILSEPKHIGLDIIAELLQKISTKSFMQNCGADVIFKSQIELLKVLSIALKYFNKQEEYIDYDNFKRDFIGIFELIINNSITFDELCEEVKKAEHRFIYTLNTKQLHYSSALGLMEINFENALTPNIKKILSNGFEIYENTFNLYKEQIFNEDNNDIKKRIRLAIFAKYKVNTLEDALLAAIQSTSVNYEEIKAILKLGVNINCSDNTGMTALHHAIKVHNEQLIKLLIIYGANINQQDNNNQTSLDYANINKLPINNLIEQAFKEYYKPVNLPHAFRLAASKGKLSHIQTLHQLNNKMIDLQGSEAKRTALHYAIMFGHPDVINWLLQNGASTNKLDKRSKTAIDHARERGIEIIFEKDKINNDEFLEKQCLIARYGTSKINEALVNAVNRGKYKDSKKLLEYGSSELSVATKDSVLKTVINNTELKPIKKDALIKLLIDHKANKTILPHNMLTLLERNSIEKIINETKELAALWTLPLDAIKDKVNSQQLPFEISYLYPLISESLSSPLELKKQFIPRILAGLAVILAMSISGLIVYKGKRYELTSNKNAGQLTYMLKPHCIQVLGILKILGLDQASKEIDNHLAEILTGQGKSWVLALLAGYFRLLNKEVVVACYSEYLTNRDQKDFEKMLGLIFDFKNVNYLTFNEMCLNMLQDNSGNSLFNITEKIIKGEKVYINKNKNNIKDKVLLLDEVDVFFSEKFGQTQGYVNTIYNKKFAELQKKIWALVVNSPDENVVKTDIKTWLPDFVREDKFLDFLFKQSFTKKNKQDNRNYTYGVLEHHIDDMVRDAFAVKNIKDDQFKIVGDKVLLKYKNDFILSFRGYQNSFYYLKEYYKGSINSINDSNCYGYLIFKVGTISFSELPKEYTNILGVTGSLSNISPSEQEMLKEYKLTKRSYLPTFFGASKLKKEGFENKHDNPEIDEKEDTWFAHIVENTRKKIAEGRSVLIFFATDHLLKKFVEDHAHLIGSKYHYITPDEIYDGNNDKAIIDKRNPNFNNLLSILVDEKAGQSGTFTLLTKEFGRGTDFKISEKVKALGGSHVIQTFLSIDKKEEIQIKGRTARKDEPGSHELIICLKHLTDNPDPYFAYLKNNLAYFFKEAKTTSNYDWLDKKRNELYEVLCKSNYEAVAAARDTHETTITFFNEVKEAFEHSSEINEQQRSEFVSKIQSQLK